MTEVNSWTSHYCVNSDPDLAPECDMLEKVNSVSVLHSVHGTASERVLNKVELHHCVLIFLYYISAAAAAHK